MRIQDYREEAKKNLDTVQADREKVAKLKEKVTKDVETVLSKVKNTELLKERFDNLLVKINTIARKDVYS